MVASRAFLFRPGIFELGPVYRHDICSWLVTSALCRGSCINASNLCGHVPALCHSALLFRAPSREHDLVFLHRVAIYARNLPAGRRGLARHALSTRRIKKRIGLATLRNLFRWDHFAELASFVVSGLSAVPV